MVEVARLAADHLQVDHLQEVRPAEAAVAPQVLHQDLRGRLARQEAHVVQVHLAAAARAAHPEVEAVPPPTPAARQAPEAVPDLFMAAVHTTAEAQNSHTRQDPDRRSASLRFCSAAQPWASGVMLG